MLSSTENSAGGGRYLLLIPPMTQLNTPYPSTAYLTGFLRSQGLSAVQEDLALALVLRVLSAEKSGKQSLDIAGLNAAWAALRPLLSGKPTANAPRWTATLALERLSPTDCGGPDAAGRRLSGRPRRSSTCGDY